ncbi:hypothetical protein V5N11_012490 [Cardamine amara subsp. amara]|uniref:Uncharacterized protein n=1 Tax=Cardamine amara subsp. amara TaxID=228776 RepID=A0ABD1AYY6_CARAN
MTRNPKKSAMAKIVVKKEIIEIESDTDDVDGRMLALCGEVNASGDDALAKNPKKSALAKTIVKKEISEIGSNIDEEYGKMLALFAQVNASGDNTLAKSPNKSAVAKTIMKEGVIEIESDTDEADGTILALCGEVNASGDDALANNPKKSDVAKTIVKKDIIEIESDTDEADGTILALCGEVNASGDDVLAKSLNESAVAKTIVKNELIEIESDTDEADGRMLALCGEVNASGNDALAKNPKKSGKTIVKNEIIEIESDTDEADVTILALCSEVNASEDDSLAKNPKKSAVAKTIVKNELTEVESGTDEADVRMLALCREVNASGDDALAKIPKKSDVANSIVKKEIIEIESDSDTDELDGQMLTLCGEVNASGDDALAKNPKKSDVAKSIVKKEIIEIESDTDTDKVFGRMLSPCGAENASRDDTFAKNGKTNRPSMQIVCADDCNSGLVRDLDYMKYLANFSELGNLFLLEDNVTGSPPPLRIMYNVVDKASDRGKAIAAKRKAKSPTISSDSKRLKTENGRVDHRTKETQQKKEDATRGRKISVAKNTIEVKPTSYVKDTQLKKGDARRGRKISEAKKIVKLKPTRNAMSQTISRDSKRLKTEIMIEGHTSISKTIPVVNTKDTLRKKREALQGRKVPVTKHNNESKSKGHVKDKLHHSLKPPKKENKESLSSMDKCYTYYFASLRNSITISKSDRQVKPVKEFMCLSDPDIIAVSNHPFFYGGKSPFEATKDGKVIDLEDGIEPGDIFNSSYSKKLMEILRKPYDETEFLKLYYEASLKRPMTRCRELRDGREIEYNVEDQLAPSYLEKYTDFNNKYCHYQKDRPRALNLLRGFFFYLENIVLEGAFKPWMHENHLTNMCFDARECKDTS